MFTSAGNIRVVHGEASLALVEASNALIRRTINRTSYGRQGNKRTKEKDAFTEERVRDYPEIDT